LSRIDELVLGAIRGWLRGGDEPECAAESLMETSDIFAAFTGKKCEAPGCSGSKLAFHFFCKWCFAELPKALQNALWAASTNRRKREWGKADDQAYVASLSWFRTHPLQGVHRAKQEKLF
jgi:hypothetical protein